VDVIGVIGSSAGLAALTYGFIRTGGNGWTDGLALAAIGAGTAVLAAFVAWERVLTRRGSRIRPLVELGLFRSRGFTWGTILATLVSFAMFGIFFVMPQYFQAVRGVNALGSGLRLLPLICGMVVGMIGGTRISVPRRGKAPLVSAKTLVTVGFALMAATLAVGATTSAASGTAFAAVWFAGFGLGLGMAMPQAMNAALGALSAERSGSGSALISALRQVGATIGVAVLGTVLNSVYRGHLAVNGLPAAASAAAKSSVVGGVQVAHALGSAPLLHAVRDAFVNGMDTMLWVCGGIALASAILALLFLPRRTAGEVAPVTVGESGEDRAELEV
jgi:hypothetical protein